MIRVKYWTSKSCTPKAFVCTLSITLTLFTCLLLIVSCAGDKSGDDNNLKLEEAVYGFHLGEMKEELFERAHYLAAWERIETPKRHYRGELYNFSKTLDRTRGVDHVRLAFLDDRLMEVIVYFNDTTIQHLGRLKREYEERYKNRARAPDGTVETVYKTYRISAPGMQVTIRRITKRPSTELYVQLLHSGLHRRLRERRKQ